MGRQGKRLSGTAKRIVLNVTDFMMMEKHAGKAIQRMNVIQRVARACQLSTSTILNIRRQAENTHVFNTPKKRYKLDRRQIIVDDFDKQAIRRAVHRFYEKHEYPTLHSLLTELKAKQLFAGCKSTLHKLLLEMGFRYRRHENRRYIYEQPHITQQRHDYLREMRSNRKSETPRPVIFLDETWCNSRHCPTHMWVDVDGSGGFKHSMGKGPRLVIVHAGAVAGWIPKAGLVFRAKAKSGDFHQEMNAEHFLYWFEHQLCPNIPMGSLIVMDNASYHNTQTEKIPTKSSRKSDMKEWLTKHGIVYDKSELKADLMKKIIAAKPTKEYHTDVIAAKFTHKVLRLPVAHPELNPIELAWSVLKGFVARNNKKFTLREVEALVIQGINTVTPAMWTSFCRHTENVENEYWKRDCLVEEVVEEMLIDVGDSSDDESSDEELSDSDDDTPESDFCDHSAKVDQLDEKRTQPCCSKQLTFPLDFLESVLPLSN